MNNKVDASILVIGNEILSGRISDKNISYLAKRLSDLGIILSEVRIVQDKKEQIVKNILELSGKYTYVFTTGGIGPTHDDITTESICEAFNKDYILNQETLSEMKKYYNSIGREINESNIKMAFLPKDSILIHNPLTIAPGFIVENVFVMAGVPEIMKIMFDNVVKYLKISGKFFSYSLIINVGESVFAFSLEELQKKYQDIDIGSYPKVSMNKHITNIVLRSKDKNILDKAFDELINQIDNLGLEYSDIEKND